MKKKVFGLALRLLKRDVIEMSCKDIFACIEENVAPDDDDYKAIVKHQEGYGSPDSSDSDDDVCESSAKKAKVESTDSDSD
jgi:hypothetical protein